MKLTADARGDLAALPSQELQRIALQWMSRLRARPRLGRRLDWREGQDLRACRKIYFDEGDRPLESRLLPSRRAEAGPRYRIVYRLLPSEDDPVYAQVLGVGPKRDVAGGIYPRVAARLDARVEE